MKRQLFNVIVLAMVLGIAIVNIVSCSKPEQEKIKTKGKITHFSPPEHMVEPNIEKFNEQFVRFQGGLKSGNGDFVLGEAIWTIEAGVNYEHGGISNGLSELTIDSIASIADVYTGIDNEFYITDVDAFTMYESFLEFAGNKVVEGETELLVADLIVRLVNDLQAEFKLKTVSGYAELENYKSGWTDCLINSDDYWKAGNELGKCGIYNGQQVGKDAADKINTLMNCIQLSGVYWTDIVTYYNVNSYFQNGNYCFYGQDMWGYPGDCLDPTEINYWFSKAKYVRDEFKPTGKTYIDCLFGDFTWSTPAMCYHRFEEIRYGIPHMSSPPHGGQ